MYFPNVNKEVIRVLTRPKLYEHLKKRYRSALLRGEFGLRLYENKHGGIVLPDQYKGEPFSKREIRTHHGYFEILLFLWHSLRPWNSDQVEGEIRFSPLRPSTTRRGVVRDSRKFPIFVQGVKSIEPLLQKKLNKSQRNTKSELADKL